MFTGKRFVAVLTILAIMLTACVSCDRYVRYEALRVVFDGVPNPDLPAVIDNMTAKVMSQKEVLPVSYEHPSGLGEDRCTLCHGGISNMVMPPADICLVCHSDVKKARIFIHGPAAIDCLACHDVHKSVQKTLVKKGDPALCFNCHYIQNRERMYDPDGHRTLQEGQLVCLPCHDSHGGKDRYFIKADAPLAAASIEKEIGLEAQ